MILNIYWYVVDCPYDMAKELQEMEKDTIVNWFNFNVGTNYYNSGVEAYTCIKADHKNKIIKIVNRNDLEFTRPDKPFMLIYESEKDGLSIAWLETEEDMMETIEEVKSYGDTIVDAIEIESCRDVNTDEI